MNNTEVLHKIFSDKVFLEENKDKKEFEEIFEAVVAIEPSITAEELDEYLVELSEAMEENYNNEFSESDLEKVSGGAVALTLTFVAGCIGGCYAAGLAIGEGIAHYKNNKKKKK
jgi:hypothetical protein